VRRRPEPRPELDDLTPYRTSGTSEGRIFLHANENPYAPPSAVMDEIAAAMRTLQLNRYPAPTTALAEQLAEYADVDADQIWIGDGANEVLLQACLAYGGPGRTALIFEPTYVMHYRQARMAGTEVVRAHRRDDFTIDVDAAVTEIERLRPDVVVVCTPNNPTGTVTARADLDRIVDAAAPALVVVDEAYYEFSGETLVGSLQPNVIVVRTMSKAFRLANIRLGYGIGDADVLEELGRVRMPYAQSGFSVLAATVALRHRDELLDVVPKIVAERDRLAATLKETCEVFESGANFVLFRPPNADALLKELDARGIVIRDFRHHEGCEGCLRVTAGRPEENDAFLAAFAATA
jgi:histidinol-phosphate aminotransferase